LRDAESVAAMGEELRQREDRLRETIAELRVSQERYRSMAEGIDDLYLLLISL